MIFLSPFLLLLPSLVKKKVLILTPYTLINSSNDLNVRFGCDSVRRNNMLVNLRGQGDFVNFIWPLFFCLLLSLHYCNTIKETISFSIPHCIWGLVLWFFYAAYLYMIFAGNLVMTTECWFVTYVTLDIIHIVWTLPWAPYPKLVGSVWWATEIFCMAL